MARTPKKIDRQIAKKAKTRPRRQGKVPQPVRASTAERSYSDPTRLGEAVPLAAEPSIASLTRQLSILTKQRDDALAAVNRRENVDLLLDRFDTLLVRVEKGMARLQRTLRVIVAVAED